MEILFQSYTAYSRYIARTIWFAYIRGGPGCHAKPPSLTPSSRHSPTPASRKENETPGTRMVYVHWSMRGWGQEIPAENEVDLEHNDYDVMCLDKMQHEKLLFYISLSFCFWVRSRFCFVFLVWGFVFPFRDYLSVSGFGFSILLVCFFFFLRVLHVYFRVLSVCFVSRA